MKSQLAEDDRPPAALSLEEYLSSSWGPDCDFVDGRTAERNVGTFPHALTVTHLICTINDRRDAWAALALPSLRIRVSPTRVRVPDVCVIARGGPREPVLSYPPLAVIEVLDDEDRFSSTMEKLADFERFGVGHIWVIDPEGRRAYRYVSSSLERVGTDALNVPDTPIRVVLRELFVELDP
jgi:Uma2 family endonuclease